LELRLRDLAEEAAAAERIRRLRRCEGELAVECPRTPEGVKMPDEETKNAGSVQSARPEDARVWKTRNRKMQCAAREERETEDSERSLPKSRQHTSLDTASRSSQPFSKKSVVEGRGGKEENACCGKAETEGKGGEREGVGRR
jgi:hypothetical protein